MKEKNFYERHRHKIKFLSNALEIFLMSEMFFIIWNVYYRENSLQTLYGRGTYVMLLNYALVMYIIYKLTDSFMFGHLKITVITISKVISILITDFFEYFIVILMANKPLKIYPLLVHFILGSILALLITYYETYLYHKYHSPHNMLLIYGTDNGFQIKKKLDSRPDKYNVDSSISSKERFEKIKKMINIHDSVILNDVDVKTRNKIVKYCFMAKKRIYLVPKLTDILIMNSDPVTLFDTPLQLIRSTGLGLSDRIIKRTIDIILSSIALVVTLPITIVVALLIKLEDGGPIFFRQDRITQDETVFNLIKFRSMKVDAEKGGYDINTMRAKKEDPRITKVGKVIRAYRIDELPQLINILKGEMSIVGPRPERVENHKAYTEEIAEWPLRTRVKGGLTGYAQIYGKYNTSAYDKLRLDLMYIQEYSTILDVKLMFMTVAVLFKKESTEGFDTTK